MKILRFLPLVSLLAAGAALRAADTPTASTSLVDVIYVHPENFTDVKDTSYGNDRVRDEYLAELKQHIESEAKHYIPAGDHLTLRITDVKMAGDFEPWRGPNFIDVRIVKSIYPPRINLEFSLTDTGGKVLKQGQEHVTNLSFLDEINIYFPDDPLRYEKALIDYWFRHEFSRLKK